MIGKRVSIVSDNRWVMNRAGILNFWFYADEVFELSEGRLIFRGANGSGKSVTMQSFLPLVLDGDKRPSRLDPFGSKDRKIEYYLLGELESGISDRTGYLYLEFIQPNTGKVITIGIGLRARRGAAQVGFWGFAVTDQRRIGKDLFLYDVDQFEKQGDKVPLDRLELETVIGEGGRVVREQGEYRHLVNQLLFGFGDIESFKDLLELLIQLRSPKLSKEFKPSTIYGILNEALPPLSDEDLRPLSEVLEDMDEIGDRLDELQIHRNEAQTLSAIYNQYNEIRLYELSSKVTDVSGQRDRKELEVKEQQQEWHLLGEEVEQTNTHLQAAQEQLAHKEQEAELLNRSEAMEKQQELETTEQRLQEAQSEIRRAELRLRTSKGEQEKKEIRVGDAQKQADQHEAGQKELRGDMDALSQELEFQDHHIYERQWQSGQRLVEESLWIGWRRDIAQYRGRLKEVHALCLQEQDSAQRAREAEAGMSAAREKRDLQERDLQAKEEAMKQSILAQEDAMLVWFKGLKQLPLSEEAWRGLMHRLQKYPELSYEEITSPVKEAWDKAVETSTAIRLHVEHEKVQRTQERDQLHAELETWRRYREPEPDRTEARSRSRSRRRQQASESQGIGAPFYACCEFRGDVDEATRAVLESVLHRAGLLDAWIPSDSIGMLEKEEEELWLRPAPVLFGYTLADYLDPVPPANSGLSVQQVEEVLRTIQVGEGENSTDNGVYVTDTGQFVLGPLKGQIASKLRAEWIGAEARKQTRLAEMQRLEAVIADLDRQIADLSEQLVELAQQLALTKQEKEALPTGGLLSAAYRTLQASLANLEHTKRIEDEQSEKYKEAMRKWRELQRMVMEKTVGWSRLKKEKDFAEAFEALQVYEGKGLELKSSLAIGDRINRELEQLVEEIELLTEQIETEEEHLEEHQIKEKQLQAAVQSLTKIIQEMGVYDIYKQLQELKEICSHLKQTIADCNDQLRKLGVELGGSHERLKQRQAELAAQEELLLQASMNLRKEWNWKLVDFGNDHPLQTAVIDSDTVLLRTAQDVSKYYRGRYESRRKELVINQLQETFALAKNALLDYSLEQRFDEVEDRLFVESLRDRNQPWTPAMLLGELTRLEEEQRLLIDEKDRELYEQILIHSVGRAIKDKINRAEQWVDEMNHFMQDRITSSGLVLSLEWTPRPARNERELDTDKLVRLLRKNPNTLLQEEIDQMVEHFRSRIRWAKEDVEDGDSLRKWIQELLDYRGWFSFTLYYRKGSQPKRELTDSRFNVLSGGEKAMAMYIPLFAATDSRFKDSRATAPRLISLDEAFAGVDDENMKDMFRLLTEMKFDYMMTSQVLWGCFETVPSLSIYEIYRPLDVDFVTVIPYFWNGYQRRMLEEGDWTVIKNSAMSEAATTSE
jgi:uncharacterized protein (TIGR02680 family)